MKRRISQAFTFIIPGGDEEIISKNTAKELKPDGDTKVRLNSLTNNNRHITFKTSNVWVV